MIEEYETVDCNVCGSSNPEQITDKGQFGFATNVCICTNCGLSFLNPRWNDATYLQFYKFEYDKYYRPAILKKPLPAEKNVGSYYPIIKRLSRTPNAMQQPLKILDVGSGDGSQLEIFQKLMPKAKLFAIEPSDQYKSILKQKEISFVSNDVNTDWDKTYSKQFDLIILRHVLEHMLDPVAVAQKLREALSDNGSVYIAVPDSLNLTQSLSGSFFRVVHTYYFNKYSMKNVLSKAKLEILAMGHEDEFLKGEMYLFAKRSNDNLEVEITQDNYALQRNYFQKELDRETTVNYKFTAFWLSLWSLAVSIKKKIIPKPGF